MQAIEIKYLPVTETKGVRFKATCEAKSITVSRDYSLDVIQQVEVIVMMLLVDLEWFVDYEIGQLKNGNYVAVLVDKKERV